MVLLPVLWMCAMPRVTFLRILPFFDMQTPSDHQTRNVSYPVKRH
jgi:hypothetical protein